MMPAMNMPASLQDSSASVVDVLVSVVGNYTLKALLDGEQRRQHKELCAERLAAQDNVDVQYAEQAVLANLDWGIDALEEAIVTSNQETKKARLEHAERMLQVSALLDVRHTTAGVPNSYLSAWAHLNLAFVWKLRNHDRNAAAHMLEMFLVDPLYSRVDFAPQLWEHLFFPHLTSIVAWYTEQRHHILSSSDHTAPDISYSKDDLSYNLSEYKNFLSTVGPEQAAQLQQLEQLYQYSLDENTRLYARYYKDWLNSDPSLTAKRGMLLMPIAEPPMTPMHELGSFPQSDKFGPQPPTSAGFSHSFGIGSTNSTPSATAPREDNVRQDGPYTASGVRQNSIWEEDESPYRAQAVQYQTDKEMTGKHGSLKKPSPGSSSGRQGNLYHPNDQLHAQKGNSFKEPSPKDKNPALLKARTLIQQSSDSSSNDKTSTARTRNSKPLMALFQDQDATMLSSSRSTSSIEKSCSSPESDLEVQEALQQKEEDHEGTPIELQGSYISSIEDEVEAVTDDDPEVPEDDDDYDEHEDEKDEVEVTVENEVTSPVSQGECSASMVQYGNGPGQNLFMLELPNIATPATRPPKDFVCPITSQIFNDPVTLETGQTYERRAIKEWLDRGNTTCPITRQTLQSTSLPKTNYVLKRVIASWKEQHPELALEFGSSDNSPCLPCNSRNFSGASTLYDQSMPEADGSPDSLHSGVSSDGVITKGRQRFNGRAGVLPSPRNLISQDSLEVLLNELKPAIGYICNSDDLQECEVAVLTIAHIWQESMGNQNIQVLLIKEAVIKGFIEVLSTSDTIKVLAATVYMLSELLARDNSVAQAIGTEDPEYDSVIGLLKRGMVSATVLLFQLRPISSQLAFSDLLPSLVGVLRKCESENSTAEPFPMYVGPKEAGVVLLDQMLTAGDENMKLMNAHSVISMDGLSPLVDSLEASSLEERISAVSILLCCMQADGSCRNYIAHRAQLTPVLELLHSGSEKGRMDTISFLSELVRLHRRSINCQLLQVIKEEGSLSTMHVLLVHLQMVPLEHRPIVAGLLLQLDLLVQPRKGSMYREESIEALIGALSNEDIPVSQVAAAETIVMLGGRFSYSGKSLTEPWLLKFVGLDQRYEALMRADRQVENSLSMNLEEEEKAAKIWEKRVAGALVNFENGLILEALGRGMKSQSLVLWRPCIVAVTWLVHMLPSLPDTGVREKARKTLMPQFISNLKSSNDMDVKALAVLALHSFIDELEGMQELVRYARDILGPLRKLKRSVPVANGIVKKLISSPIVNAPEFWTHEELGSPTDVSANGEVRCLAQSRGRVFSGHSDGTLKVWDSKKRLLTLVQEIKEHQKSVTCLCISSLGDKLYSSSLDKTIRVWAIGPAELHCIKFHDTKEPVLSLVVNSTMICFAPQGTGVRILNEDAGSTLSMGNKHVQSLAMADGKLYCGCTHNSIQEVDLAGGQPAVIQQAVRTLLGKKPIYALQVFNDKLYSAGSSVDGMPAKVWSLSDKSLVGQLASNSDIRTLAVNDEFIYLGSSSGSIEVWLRERMVKVAGMNVGSKLTALLVLDNLLFCGSEDGKIRGWEIS